MLIISWLELSLATFKDKVQVALKCPDLNSIKERRSTLVRIGTIHAGFEWHIVK